MELTPKIKIKFIQSYYCNKNAKGPYPHLKLYLMDVPKISKKINKPAIKAFISSANFTEKGFKENLEFFVETNDFNVTEQLYNFFCEMYNNENFYTHQQNYIIKKLFSFGLIKHKE